MADRYKLKLSKSQRKLLGVWDRADPVDQWERQRNLAIESIQGNGNSFVQ
jgi:deoxyribonuclease-1